MTAVANSEHASSKLLWSGRDVNASSSGGLSKRSGTQTWTPSSKMAMSRSQHEQPQVGKVAVGKEQTSKHTWPRRRDVSSLWYFSGWSFDPRAERVLQF